MLIIVAKTPSSMFDSVLDVFLHYFPNVSYWCFTFIWIWISKVTDYPLLRKAKKKEQNGKVVKLFAHLTPVLLFRWHLVMFCVITVDIWWMFRVPTKLEDDLPSFKFFRKIALTISLQKARRGRDSPFHTHAFWGITSTI